jgi:very-short-patch-repair endonuclease
MISNRHVVAKLLRKNFTDAERALWKNLKAKQMEEYKFRRQEPIGSYIVDFVCHAKRIVIEVDGGQHSIERDGERDQWLREQGYSVLRFWNNEVLGNIEGVLEVVRDRLRHPPPTPPIKGGGKSKYTHQGREGIETSINKRAKENAAIKGARRKRTQSWDGEIDRDTYRIQVVGGRDLPQGGVGVK